MTNSIDNFWAYIAEDYSLEEGWAVIQGKRVEILSNDDEDRDEEDYDDSEYKRVVGPDGDDALYQADKWVAVWDVEN